MRNFQPDTTLYGREVEAFDCDAHKVIAHGKLTAILDPYTWVLDGRVRIAIEQIDDADTLVDDESGNPVIELYNARIVVAPLTVKGVRSTLADRRMSLVSLDGEFRVNYQGGKNATAYFTGDLQDALNTGLHMADHPPARPVAAAPAAPVRFGRGGGIDGTP